MAEPKDRILELRRVPAADLQADPRNFRRHPAEQRRALEQMRERLGVVNAVIARETPDGLILIDGHLRTDMAGAELVPVIVTNLTEEEAAEAMATLDPIAAMAIADNETLHALLDVEIADADAELRTLLDDLHGRDDPALFAEPVILKDADAEAEAEEWSELRFKVPREHRRVIMIAIEEILKQYARP